VSFPTNTLDTLRNGEGATISAASVVRVSGDSLFSRAQANSAPNVAGYVGVLRTLGDVPASAPGNIVVAGLVDVLVEVGLAPSPGDQLWISPTVAGRVTTVQPGANAVRVGVVKSATQYAVNEKVTALVGSPGAALGGGGTENLAETYDLGASVANQTMTQLDAKGGRVTFDASGAGFTQERSVDWITPGGQETAVMRSGRLAVYDEDASASETEEATLAIGARASGGVSEWIKSASSGLFGPRPLLWWDAISTVANGIGDHRYRHYGNSATTGIQMWRIRYQYGANVGALTDLYREEVDNDSWVTVLQGTDTDKATRVFQFDSGTNADFIFTVAFGAQANAFAERLSISKDAFFTPNAVQFHSKDNTAAITAASNLSLRTSNGIITTYTRVTGATTIDHIRTNEFADIFPSATLFPHGAPVIILHFQQAVTVTHDAGAVPAGSAKIWLDGGVDFNATIGDLLCLALLPTMAAAGSGPVATAWTEQWRKVLPAD